MTWQPTKEEYDKTMAEVVYDKIMNSPVMQALAVEIYDNTVSKMFGGTLASTDASIRSTSRDILKIIDDEQVDQPAMSFEHEVLRIFAKAYQIMVEKRLARGPNNITEQGLSGVINRLRRDKLERVQNYADNLALLATLEKRNVDQSVIDQIVPVEHHSRSEWTSVMDDLLDTVNYAAIGVMLLRNTWDLPMVSDPRRNASAARPGRSE